MRTKEWALEMALYSKWQNEKLTGLCDGLGDAARCKDRGMFFGSIHATLDHILMVDRVLWAFASTGEPIRNFDPDTKLFDDYEALKRERLAFDDRIIEEIRAHPPNWLGRTINLHHPPLGGARAPNTPVPP